ncbi:MAG: LacI family DNA-binding transcriptional regulator [Micropruina sp.]|nr:MAG: LacI family DNA-binding transcriptional regulator [Micropruina sp.]
MFHGWVGTDPRGRISVRELARRVGVSPATVTRVLHERSEVSEETRALVLEGVRTHGHPYGQGGHAGTPFVGIVIPDLQNPAFAAMAGAIEHQLSEHGISSLIGSFTLRGFDERQHIDVILRHGAHGLILVSGWHANLAVDHSPYARLYRQGIPMVFVSGLVEGLRVPSVGTNEELGTRLAVDHLVSLGHRRIGLANGALSYRPSVNRLKGFIEGLARNGLTIEPALQRSSPYTMDGARASAEKLLRAGATAIVCGSDVMAVGVAEAVRELGLRVPDDVSIVGYDDGALAAHANPPLTTLRQPIGRIADATAQAMDDLLTRRPLVRLHQRFDPTLVQRESTGPAPR